MGDSPMGMQARLMSWLYASFRCDQTNECRQLYLSINCVKRSGSYFGNPKTTTGGDGIEVLFIGSTGCARIQSIKLGSEIIGNRTRVRVVKNKVAAPFRTAEFDIMYNEGISKAGDVLDLATELNIIEKRGSFYSYADTRLGQGRENAKDFLRQNPDLMNEIELTLRQQALSGDMALPLGGGGGGEDSGFAEDEE
jgi:recombination protein RecA